MNENRKTTEGSHAFRLASCTCVQLNSQMIKPWWARIQWGSPIDHFGFVSVWKFRSTRNFGLVFYLPKNQWQWLFVNGGTDNSRFLLFPFIPCHFQMALRHKALLKISCVLVPILEQDYKMVKRKNCGENNVKLCSIHWQRRQERGAEIIRTPNRGNSFYIYEGAH